MNRLKTILARVLEVDENGVNDEMSPDDVDTWDSLHGLMLVSEIESQFKVQFTMNEVTGMKCVKDIKDSLKRHGVELE